MLDGPDPQNSCDGGPYSKTSYDDVVSQFMVSYDNICHPPPMHVTICLTNC